MGTVSPDLSPSRAEQAAGEHEKGYEDDPLDHNLRLGIQMAKLNGRILLLPQRLKQAFCYSMSNEAQRITACWPGLLRNGRQGVAGCRCGWLETAGTIANKRFSVVSQGVKIVEFSLLFGY